MNRTISLPALEQYNARCQCIHARSRHPARHRLLEITLFCRSITSHTGKQIRIPNKTAPDLKSVLHKIAQFAAYLASCFLSHIYHFTDLQTSIIKHGESISILVVKENCIPFFSAFWFEWAPSRYFSCPLSCLVVFTSQVCRLFVKKNAQRMMVSIFLCLLVTSLNIHVKCRLYFEATWILWHACLPSTSEFAV